MLKTSNLALAYVVVTVLFLLLSSIIILFLLIYQKRRNEHAKEMAILRHTYDQGLLQSQIEVQESTLSTLSKELHDNIGQLLGTAKMLLGVAEGNIINPPESLLTANQTLGKAIVELRAISKSLSKEWLEQFDLIKNLEAEVNRVNSANTITIRLEHSGTLYINVDEQIILFRIIQEAILNAIKHSKSSSIIIKISIEDNFLITIIRDNGKEFKHHSINEGVGILNMKHRTKLLGGTIDWIFNDEGTTVLIKLPVKPEEK